MRRTKLIWFALGAGTCALAGFGAMALSKTEQKISYLVVSDRAPTEEELEDVNSLVSTSGEMLRECGATKFLIKANRTADDSRHSLAKMSDLSDATANCVLTRAENEGFSLGIWTTTETNAQTH